MIRSLKEFKNRKDVKRSRTQVELEKREVKGCSEILSVHH